MQDCAAQQKNDYIWLFGNYPNDKVNQSGGSKLDFNFDPPLVSFFELPEDFYFHEISMVSDSLGELRFYTNGCKIINRNHQLMTNGDSINAGETSENYCPVIGYPTQQSTSILPLPGSNELYYLFHLRVDGNSQTKDFLYSVIDMSKDGGLGMVVIKNEWLFSTEQLAEQLTAVRHANGRDWRLVLPNGTLDVSGTNKYYFFLLTPDGITEPTSQDIGDAWDFQYYSGQATFSPDGTKYARMNPFNGLRIFDFDRCSGEFSNPVNIYFPNDTIISGGVAFSPNSRFLYVSAGVKVYQFDTWAANIEASRKTVAVYDGFMSPLWTLFYQQMLAPDGKIYITVPNSANVLHVIHAPDQPGDACQFEQHGLTLPTLHDWSIPNFPHFRLYDLPGSPCDTLGIDGPVATGEAAQAEYLIHVYPNPADEYLSVDFNLEVSGSIEWSLYTTIGQKVKQVILAKGQTNHTVSLAGVPPGLYFWKATSQGRQVGEGKVVVLK